MKKPRAKQRDFKIGLKCLGHRDSSGNPCCLAGYFTWPQVALTHHVCHRCLYAPRAARVKQGSRWVKETERPGSPAPGLLVFVLRYAYISLSLRVIVTLYSIAFQ